MSVFKFWRGTEPRALSMCAGWRSVVGIGLVAVGLGVLPVVDGMRLGVASAAAASGRSAKSEADLFGDEVLATGQGVSVKSSQLEEAFVLFKANLASRGQTLPEEKRAVIEGQLLDKLIVTQILMGMATPDDREKAKVAGAKFVEQTRKQAGTEEAFRRQIVASGMTMAKFDDQIAERAVCEQVLDRLLKTKVTITDEIAKKYYEDNPKRFLQPEMARVKHILIATRDLGGREFPESIKSAKKEIAQKLLERARKGESFDALVKEASDDRGSKDKGGEYTFPRGQMAPEFEATAFSLAPNQISDLVVTTFGFHIIKALERIPEKKVPYSQAEIDIKEKLAFDEVQKQLPEFFEKLRKEAKVTVTNAGKKP